MSGGLRLTAIADLHMSAGTHEDFHEDAALVAFLDALRERAAARPARTRLLLLGDTLDFSRIELSGRRKRRLDGSCAAAIEKLELAASTHADVFAALGRLAESGVRIELVPGNHDLELCYAPVRECLVSLLQRASDERATRVELRVHRWIFHVPGLVYAEHGHQHHDLNRTPGLLHAGAGEPLPVPLGTRLGEWLLEIGDARNRSGGVLRTLPATLRLLAGARSALYAGERERPRELEACARSTGLPEEVPSRIDARALTPPADLARRLLRVAAGRWRAAPDLYVREAAGAVERILAAAGSSVPYYLFAHTHVAADAPLGGGGRYLNPGTWSTLRPRDAGQTSPRLTFVQFAHDPDEAPQARLMEWDPAVREARPLPGTRPKEPVAP